MTQGATFNWASLIYSKKLSDIVALKPGINDEIFVTGRYLDSTDFDPDTANYNWIYQDPAHFPGSYLACFDNTGALVRLGLFETTLQNQANDMSIDPANNIYLNYFAYKNPSVIIDSIDLDLGPGVQNQYISCPNGTGQSVYFLLKYDSAFVLDWILRDKFYPHPIDYSSNGLLVLANGNFDVDMGKSILILPRHFTGQSLGITKYGDCPGQNYDSTIQVSECSTFTTPSGNFTWDSTGVYSEKFTGVQGCDSVILYDLTILGSDTILHETSCFDFTTRSGNHTWDSSGTYIEILTNQILCDSIITYHLTIIEPDISVNIIPGTGLHSPALSSTFQWLDCDSNYAIIPGASQSLFLPSGTGNYALEVKTLGCVDTSDCYSFIVSGLQDQPRKMELYPNPIKGKFQIILGKEVKIFEVDLRDIRGNKMEIDWIRINSGIELELNHPKGLYFLRLKTDLGYSRPFKLIKE